MNVSTCYSVLSLTCSIHCLGFLERRNASATGRAGQCFGLHFFGFKSPATRARQLFKPSTDSARLQVDIKKNVFRFRFLAFPGGNIRSGGVFAFFWPPSSGPGTQPI